MSQIVLDHIAAAGLLVPSGWIIAQHHKKEEIVVPTGFELFRRSRYGDTCLSFFRSAGRSRPAFASV